MEDTIRVCFKFESRTIGIGKQSFAGHTQDSGDRVKTIVNQGIIRLRTYNTKPIMLLKEQDIIEFPFLI